MSAVPAILILDDDHDLRAGLHLAFEGRGYRVTSAGDGLSGLELAAHVRPDVVILDMLLPGKSGFAVLEQLKTKLGPGLRAVMLSGNTHPHHRDLALFLGADEFVAKPFALSRLLGLVERLCPTHDRTSPQPAAALART